MGEQGAGSGYDSTLAPGHSRSQTADETTSSEQASDACGPSKPSQRKSSNSFASSILSSEQDPRSAAAGTGSGARSPSVGDSLRPSMAYEPSPQHGTSLLQQHQQQQQQKASKAQDTKLARQPTQIQRAQEAIKLEKQRRQQRKPCQPQKFQQLTRQHQQQERHQQQKENQPLSQLDLNIERHHVQPQEFQHCASFENDTSSSPADNFELPVTRDTLSELDVYRIIHNPKLRHDINYDPELHFRPNLDGEKGRRKQEKAQQFWDGLRSDLVQFVTDRDTFLMAHGPDDNEWSLPVLLNAVKDIIQTLVPTRDRGLLDEGLNVPLLMQQFIRGVVDLEKLAEWLSSVLKMHCAPMRDDWVDEMYSELSRGNRDNNVDELVKGLCSLLTLLEAMKLDVANHQVRCLRPLLIEDTVHFERRFFCKKIQSGSMCVSVAQDWYQQTKSSFSSLNVRHERAFGIMAPFFSGLVDFLLPSADVSQVPNTFLFDEDRIVKLRSDMFDAIQLEVCMKVYEIVDAEEERLSRSAVECFQPRRMGINTIPSFLDAQQQAGTCPGVTSPTALVDFDFNTPPQSPASDSSTLSRPPSISLSACDSDSSETCGFAGLLPRQPNTFAIARERSQNLYASLVTILQSAHGICRPSERWDHLWPLMAVEIYRTLLEVHRAQRISLERIETFLQQALNPEALLKQQVEQVFRDRLDSALARRVKEYKTMTNVGLFVEAAGGQIHAAPARAPEDTLTAVKAVATAAAASAARLPRKSRAVDPRKDGCVEDMATRLAHLGVLHWRVWGQLVYEPQTLDSPFLA
ncbi:Protein SOSEKI 1 [Sporothrix epigloea]|uniref:Protein SOSEKI 1 n=1 Tax=Sporothrix epigloea TaxID=1892477 RepID=A0ABP0DBI8_9PEZI